jgi:hypothetical protein
MRQSTIRRLEACCALTRAVAATAAAIIVATGASAADPAAPQERPVPSAAHAAAPERAAGRVRIAWVGDTMLGHAGAAPVPADGDALFAGVRDELRAPDLTFGNLEGVLAAGGASKCGAAPAEGCYAFRADPGTAVSLAHAGFDIVNLANNHAWDYGATGQAETLAALGAHDVAHTGRPGQVTVVHRNGTSVAFVGFAPYPWAASILDVTAAAGLVRAAGRSTDVVVVALHAGAEGAGQTHTPAGREFAFGEDRGDTRAFAHAVVAAGADLVVGSGPHVLRGIERYRGRLIAYSLGNFAGWHNFATGGLLSLSGLLEVTLDRSGRTVGGRLRSLAIAPPGLPAPDPAQAAGRLVEQLSAQDFGADGVTLDADGRIAPGAS